MASKREIKVRMNYELLLWQMENNLWVFVSLGFVFFLSQLYANSERVLLGDQKTATFFRIEV